MLWPYLWCTGAALESVAFLNSETLVVLQRNTVGVLLSASLQRLMCSNAATCVLLLLLLFFMARCTKQERLRVEINIQREFYFKESI